MVEGLLLSALAPFTIAIGVMLAIATTEAMGTLFGISPSGLVDQMLPDIDVDADVDIDADADAPDADGGGMLSSVLGWLCVGRVPFLVLLVAFLTAFGLAGIVVQTGTFSIAGLYLPLILAVPAAMFLALWPTRWLAMTLAAWMPKEETDAVSSCTFIGRVATITRGIARSGIPAEAKLRDSHGQMHYVLVEPDNPGASFEQGSEVLLTSQSSAIRFKAIANTNALLSQNQNM